jgi:hypothetical protein
MDKEGGVGTVTPSLAFSLHAARRELYVPNSSGGRFDAVEMPLRRLSGFCRLGMALTRGRRMGRKWRNLISDQVEYVCKFFRGER